MSQHSSQSFEAEQRTRAAMQEMAERRHWEAVLAPELAKIRFHASRKMSRASLVRIYGATKVELALGPAHSQSVTPSAG